MFKALTGFVDDINVQQGIIKPVKKQIFDTDQLMIPFGGNVGQREHSYGDPESLNRLYEKIIWVYRCVNLIASNVARLPYRVVKVDSDDNETDLSDRPEFFALFNPNKFQTKFDFIYESIARLTLQGEMFWELTLIEGSNRIAAMYADWMSSEVEIHADADNFITGYDRTVNGERTPFKPEEVFFIKYFNPFSSLRGMSPLRAGRDIAILELNAVASNKNFFKQGMRLSGVFTTDKTLHPDEAKRMQESLQEVYGSTRQMHRPAVLWGGLKFDSLSGQSLRDAEYSVLREMNREDICAIFGVPLEAIGLGQRTFENLSKAERLLWNMTLIPIVQKVQAMINHSFIPRVTNDDAIKFRFDLSNVEALQEDRSQKMIDYEKGAARGAITPNDIRVDVFNKEPLEVEGMDTPYLPANLFPVGSPPEAPQSPNETRALAGKQADELDASTFEKRTAIWKQKILRIEVHERRFNRMIKKFFKQQEKEVIENLRKSQERSQKQDENIIREGTIFDTEHWEEILRKLGDPLIIDAFLDAVEEVIDNLDDFDMTHPSVRAALANRTKEFSIRVNETTRKEIEKQLREGFAAQESIDELAQRIKDNVFSTRINDVRARRIARTEAVGSSNAGIMEGIRQSPSLDRKMWLSSRDSL